MRFAAVLVIWGWLALVGHAGLYNTAEPDDGLLSPDFLRQFRPTLFMLRSIGMEQVPKDNPLRKRYILLAAAAPAVVPPTWTVEQKLNLSAYLIRRKKLNEARQVLEPLARPRQENFLVCANLGTLYHLLEEWGRSRDYLEQSLQLWPKEWSGLSPGQKQFLEQIGWNESSFAWYRQAETYHLKLVRLRAREALTAKGKDPFQRSVDALFDDGGSPPQPVRFVGESGEFEPGKLATAEKAKLPKDALAIVQQLLLWLPDDLRLYWLLGELYNAQGQVAAAREIVRELVESRYQRYPELLDHRHKLGQFQESDGGPDISLPVDPSAEPKKPEGEAIIHWRSLGVGFFVGVVVAFFAYWQVREIGRRMRGKWTSNGG